MGGKESLFQFSFSGEARLTVVGSFVEEFPEQWKEAQQRGLDEREFALESIKIMGEDVRDLSERDDDDWDVMTL